MSTCVITKKEDLVNRVVTDYENNSVELNSLYFDFEVNMPVRDILDAYAELQDSLNGDEVTFPEDVAGEYTGNCMAFLESLNGVEGYARTTDGVLLDFVF